jgi:transcriptional regulator with XRE-family HTH domain
MIAYYEAQGGNVSADMMAKLANTLDVSVDHLLNGQKTPFKKQQQPPNDLRLMRKLRMVERLPAKDRRSVLQIIDVLLERQALKQAHSS